MFIKPLKRGQRGFTLAELMVAVGVGGFVMAAVAALMVYTARAFAATENYYDLDTQSRQALDRMSYMLRRCSAINSYTPTSLNLTLDGQPLQYVYDDRNQVLNQIYTNTTTALLTNCTALRFDVYQRTTQSGTFDQFMANTNLNDPKMIQMNWLCIKDIYVGDKMTSQSIQSAKIVVRNQ